MNYIEEKYIRLIGGRLDFFKRKKDKLYTCRCPICGDSKKSKTKTRFYIFEKDAKTFVKCHNCQYSNSFKGFLKYMDTAMYNEMVVEEMADGGLSDKFPAAKTTPKNVTVTDAESNIRDLLVDCREMYSLQTKHPARLYLQSRQIPSKALSLLWYTDDFKKLVEAYEPVSAEKWKSADKRIVIPIFNRNKKLVGLQGRSITGSKLRYVTLKIVKDEMKVFGLDRVDLSKTVYVTEGPFDSLFLDNAIAMTGADANVDDIGSWRTKYVFIFDNEPRSKEICDRMSQMARLGHDVVIWPKHIHEKDINDMVLNGTSIDEIKEVIDKHSYSSMRFNVEMAHWRK